MTVSAAAAAPAKSSPARFAAVEELTCYYDRPGEPANVHIEARVGGRLDGAALRAAVRAVLEAELAIMARQAPTSRWRPYFYWDLPVAPDVDPVLVASYRDEAELARLRSALLSQAPPLRTSPPLRFLLATGPGGDALILNAHHARFDGLSCVRLIHSVADRYGAQLGQAGLASGWGLNGEQGGGPRARAAQPAGGRTAGAAGHAGSARPDRGPRPARATTLIGPITKIAREPEPGPALARHGYGTHQVTWSGLADANRLRSAGASVNDVMIAALMVTIAGWNQVHGRRSGLIRITMPVGDRSQTGSGGQWANASRLTCITARVGARVAAEDLLADVAAQARKAREQPGDQIDMVSRTLVAAPVPVAVKLCLLRAALSIAGPFLCDSSLVSNLGVVDPPVFGGAAATQLWFSTSAHMPRGLSLGAVTTAGLMHLTFRYRRALLTDAAAAAFARRYCEMLDLVTGRQAAA
jgi:NRPS condensation-like uncharacterized protein